MKETNCKTQSCLIKPTYVPKVCKFMPTFITYWDKICKYLKLIKNDKTGQKGISIWRGSITIMPTNVIQITWFDFWDRSRWDIFVAVK